MTPRELAMEALSEVHGYTHPGHAASAAVSAVAWAVLDLADAIREDSAKPATGTQVGPGWQCWAESPPEATSRCVRLPGHDGEHLDNTGGSWPQ